MNDELKMPEDTVVTPPEMGIPAVSESIPEPQVAPNLQLGQIVGLQYGQTDNGIGMSFVIKLLQGSVGMFMTTEQVNQLIETYNIVDLNVLMQQKQACAVEVTPEGQVKFVKLV